MPKKPEITLPEADAKSFTNLLRLNLKTGQYGSIAEAVPVVFGQIRTRATKDHPLQQYSEKVLRTVAANLPPAQSEELNALCNIPASVMDRSQQFVQPAVMRLFGSMQDRQMFVKSVLEDTSRPRLSMKYDVPMEVLPFLLEVAASSLLRTGRGNRAEILEKIVHDPETKTARPVSADWPYPPSREEVLILTRLQNDARPKDPAVEVNIPTSLSGDTVTDLAPARSGKSPVKPKANRLIHGR